MHITITDNIIVPAQTVQTPFGPHTIASYPLTVKFDFDLPSTNDSIATTTPPAASPTGS